MKVYYEEMDGQLFPQWLLLPATSLHAPLSVQLDAPFERMEAEDFHDDLTVVTVTQAGPILPPAGRTLRVGEEILHALHLPHPTLRRSRRSSHVAGQPII